MTNLPARKANGYAARMDPEVNCKRYYSCTRKGKRRSAHRACH